MDHLYDTWFAHSEWWFHTDNEVDRLITDLFWSLLDDLLDEKTSDANINKRTCIARILLYDQVPRHALRGQVADHVIAYYLQKALEMARACLDQYMHSANPETETLTDLELCFVLLPLRHTGIPHLCWEAAEVVWKRLRGREQKSRDIGEKGGENSHLIRFLKATYQRCPVHDQGAYLMHADDEVDQVNNTGEAAIWDFTPFESILEYAPVPVPVSMASDRCHEKRTLPSSHPCWVAMRQFVKAHLAACSSRDRVVVSVSGGVDSMVLLALLIEMRQVLGLGLGSSFEIVAFHVNYANRGAESLLEEAFVRAWCCHRLKCFGGDTVVVRRISEIQREPCMAHGLRSTYETYTRDVRYACYRTLCQGSGGMVLLGHNQDDCFENVLTNLCAQEKYEDLKGMQETSRVAGILFGRPFLGVAKADLYGAARILGIPYVQDSTPAWSQRGRIRDHVRPALTEWNPRILDGFFALSDTLQGFYALFEGQLQYCLEHTQWHAGHAGHATQEKRQEKRCTLLVPSHMHALLSQPLFWRAYLKALVGVVPSMKALHACLPKLELATGSSIALVLCKDIEIRVHKHGVEIRSEKGMDPSIRWTLDIRVSRIN